MTGDDIGGRMTQQISVIAAFFVLVLIVGTVGYHHLGGPDTTWLNSLYMTVITVTTIGYGEIVDLSGHPGGRVFTMVLAFFGIGIVTYIVISIATLAVRVELSGLWRKRKMERALREMTGHYIVAGWSDVATDIVQELRKTKRPFVVVAANPEAARHVRPAEGEPLIEGEPTDDRCLAEAGVARAAGLFAAADDDPLNIVITLTARQCNPKLRIVANVRDRHQTAKLERVGADAVVSTVAIGGLRMASEMVRPTVVSFLDLMLRSPQATLRVEEVALAPDRAGQSVGELDLSRFADALLLAARRGKEWRFNPAQDYRLESGDVLVFMTTPKAFDRLRAAVGADDT